MTAIPERLSLKRRPGSAQLVGLFDVLEVPRVGAFERSRKGRDLNVRRRRGGWWHRNAGELHELLRDLFVAYQRTIRRVHPDVPGGCHETAVEVNRAWAKVKKLFSQRGITLN